jgi:hypothetical protein
MAFFTWLSSMFGSVRPASGVRPVPEEQLVGVEPLEEALGDGADKGERGLAQNAARAEHRGVRQQVAQLVRGVEPVRHHSQAGPDGEEARHRRDRGAALQDQDVAVAHKALGGVARDAVLAGRVDLLLRGVARLHRRRAHVDRAAVRAPHLPLLLKQLEVAPDGHGRHAVLLAQGADAGRLPLLNVAEDLLPPPLWHHTSISLCSNRPPQSRRDAP